MAERATLSFSRPQQGPFSVAVYRGVLEKVLEGNVFTLTVSTGDEERVFFFTRGAILFLAVGTTGGEILARKILAKGLMKKEKLDKLVERANQDTPLLQDILRDDMLLDPKVVSQLVEETIEDHLLEVMLWDGSLALFDLVPGNPPPRLYEPQVPALRLSIGSKPLLERVLGKREEAYRVLSALGGSLRHRISLAPATALRESFSKHISAVPRPIADVVAQAQLEGEPPWKTVSALAGLLGQRKLVLERVAERTKEEEIAQALRIEDAFAEFVNALLARTHLAAIYEKADEKEKAVEQYRGIAEEHLKRDAIDAGLAALRNVVRLIPEDLAARELLVKVLRGANRLADAARESVDLARVLLEEKLPGRARQAYELALKLVPKSLSVLWMLAGLLTLLNEKEEAVKRYEEIAQIAREKNDQDAEIAAYQQVLLLEPKHKKALSTVRSLSGYAEKMRRRIAAVSVSFIFTFLVLLYGSYEMAAVRAYEAARDQASAALESQEFDRARSSVNEFLRAWTLTRLRSPAGALLEGIDSEERTFKSQRSLREEREAKGLEAKEQLPLALQAYRQALEDAEPERKPGLAQALAACEARIKKVQDELARAAQLEKEGLFEPAWQAVAEILPHAPWLLESKDVRVPFLLDSVPKEARVVYEGELQEKTTPLVLKRPLSRVLVRVEGKNREPVERELSGPLPWPLVLVLPKKPSWRAKDLEGTGAPLLVHDLVVAASDRGVSACARDSGAPRWRTSLGVFGDVAAPGAVIEQGILVLRTCSGTAFGLSTAGAVRWSRDLLPPPQDALDSKPGRPVPAQGGCLLRDGARGLVLLGPDGAPVWRTRAASDLTGAPLAASGLALACSERRLVAFRLATGEPAWSADLPRQAVLGPVQGPGGSFYAALEQGAVARIDPRGRLVSVTKDLFDACSAIEGDPRWTLVGSQSGDVLALDEAGKTVFRAFTDQQRPVLWIRASAYSVLYGDAAMLYVLDREGKDLWRHPCENAPEAAADDRQVYLGGASLEAFDR